ncbi:hypothetical protein FE782_10505 [Paenibacillus antri]|uniref:Uncharacterized protein n=1 Tax=Paenibacillus antri TaxID=2582848 RepID=A0A5R9GE52_9BACL|nr:hypothetical protein [Paenibacillus antri]TLS52390.1 hypothetical protein FE782_10505 [Paenibacillus antri]
MKIVLMTKDTKTKLFKLTRNDDSILVLTRYVDTKPEVQAEYLEYKAIRYNRWKEHGSFIKLVNKCLKTNYSDKRGDRKVFLEHLFNERYEKLLSSAGVQ